MQGRTNSWVPLGLSWLAGFNSRAPLLAVGPLLPLLQHDLNLSATWAGAISGAPLLLMGIISMPGGVVTDRLGAGSTLDLTQIVTVLAGAARGLWPHPFALVVA